MSNATYAGTSDPTRVVIGDGVGLGTIVNTDQAALTVENVSKVETDSGTTNFVFTVTLSAAVEGGFTVLAFQGTAGEQRTFTVQVNGDRTVELNETFTVSLSNLVPLDAGLSAANVNIADTAAATIQNDYTATVSIANVSQVGTNAGTTNVMFTFTLDRAVDAAVTLSAQSIAGTATAGGFIVRTHFSTLHCHSGSCRKPQDWGEGITPTQNQDPPRHEIPAEICKSNTKLSLASDPLTRRPGPGGTLPNPIKSKETDGVPTCHALLGGSL